jgi:YD repeat-containing protein
MTLATTYTTTASGESVSAVAAAVANVYNSSYHPSCFDSSHFPSSYWTIDVIDINGPQVTFKFHANFSCGNPADNSDATVTAIRIDPLPPEPPLPPPAPPAPPSPFPSEPAKSLPSGKQPTDSCANTPYPIDTGTGSKLLQLTDFETQSGLMLSRFYHSASRNLAGLSMGRAWRNNFDYYIEFVSPSTTTDRSYLRLHKPNGQVFNYSYVDGIAYAGDADVGDSVQRLDSGANTAWRYKEASSGRMLSFSNAGKLVGIFYANGLAVQINRNSSTVSGVDFAGRVLLEALNSGGYVQSAVLPNGGAINYQYASNGNIEFVTFEDGGKVQYKYENATYWYALTSILDEGGGVYANYKYDAAGRGYQENFGGLVSYKIDYNSDGSSIITDPVASIRQIKFVSTNGLKRFAGLSQPAGSGCSAATSNVKYDDNGNVASKDDFNGHRTCYANDLSRKLELTRVEGLTGQTGANAGATPTTCSAVTGAGSILPTGSRKITTQWHPQWAMKTAQAEPLLKTTWVYNGQPDPFNGNQIASCTSPMYGATSVAALPDGSPIAVLCKKVEQATLDTNGSQGLSATLAPNSADYPVQRQWSYTYNQYGQVLTSTDPLGNTTTNAYYTDTSFTGTDPNAVGHYMGDLKSATNAAGHVTSYTSYDKAGRVLSMSDPNGLIISYSYWPRGWTKSVTVGGLSTTYDYWPTGLLKKVTQPDASYLYYQYDDAHRLTDVADQVDASGNLVGNKVHYTLDNAGNRLSEDVRDTSGALTRNITRTFDALNRLSGASLGAVQ